MGDGRSIDVRGSQAAGRTRFAKMKLEGSLGPVDQLFSRDVVVDLDVVRDVGRIRQGMQICKVRAEEGREEGGGKQLFRINHQAASLELIPCHTPTLSFWAATKASKEPRILIPGVGKGVGKAEVLNKTVLFGGIKKEDPEKLCRAD